MTEHGCKHFADMMPDLIARRRCPENGFTNMNSTDISLFRKCIVCPNRASQFAQAIRTYFDHSIRSAIIIVIINNLITGVAAMIITMRNFFFIPRSLLFIILYFIVRAKNMGLFPYICLISLTSYAPARSNVFIRSECLDRNSRGFPHCLHISQPP